MSTLVIRNLPDALHARLKAQAARNRRSMTKEAEALLAAGTGMEIAALDSTSVDAHSADGGAAPGSPRQVSAHATTPAGTQPLRAAEPDPLLQAVFAAGKAMATAGVDFEAWAKLSRNAWR